MSAIQKDIIKEIDPSNLEILIKDIHLNLEYLDKRIKDLDKKIDSSEDRILSNLEYHMSKIENSFESINNRMWSNFTWTIGFGIGLYGTLFGVLGKILKLF